MDDLTINRDIDLDLSEADLWALVGDGEAWADWLVDGSDVEVVTGGEGSVVDDGERRHVHVDDVEPGRRVQYRWWPDAQPASVSTVELVVMPRPDGSTLRIRETLRASAALQAAAPHAGGSASMRWQVRSVALWSCTAALVAR